MRLWNTRLVSKYVKKEKIVHRLASQQKEADDLIKPNRFKLTGLFLGGFVLLIALGPVTFGYQMFNDNSVHQLDAQRMKDGSKESINPNVYSAKK